MSDVSIRDLRNEGGTVIDRVAQGEHITITRSGKAVAELRAVARPGLTAEALVARHRTLPAIDRETLRADIDQAVDASL